MSKNNTEPQVSDEEILGKHDEYIKALKSPKTTLTDDKLSELKRNVVESMSMDRHKLLMRQPFTGGMLMRFEFVPVRDHRLATASTDGSRIFFDISFYKSLDEDERIFVLAHECWHCVYLHFMRQMKRDHSLWNIAADCEINYMLENETFKVPKGVCFPPHEVEGKSAEEIYEYLLKTQSKKNKASKSSGKGKDGENSTRDEKTDKNGSKGGLSGQFDKHTSKDDNKNDGGDQKKGILPTDEWGEKGEDSDYNPIIDDDTAEKIREGVISEAQKIERQKGCIPGCVQRIINKFRQPEIPWQTMLSQFVTKCLGDRRQWLPPLRRSVWSGVYQQSRRGQEINVVCTVDTSGSTMNDLPKFMSELISLLKTFGKYKLTLIQCDCSVQGFDVYDDYNEFPVENCGSFKWKGMGGSDLNPAFDELIKRGTEATMHIIFTDGYITVPSKNPLGIPTMFVLTKDGNESLCDWGTKLKFKSV